jgi:iron complex outermembrane receptor protein
MSFHRTLVLAGVSLISLSAPAFANDVAQQAQPAASADSGDIVVTARRKDERLQDVPKVVNVVSGSELDKLNIRQFQDVQSTVPGLTLQDNGTGYSQKTTLRGVSFDVTAGADATVDFYMNDASIQQTYLFRTLYDIQQIEVLRGPQGTLRGRATPSGSITVTTHQPDLYKVGGYVDTTQTGSSIGGSNFQGAVNVPLIQGVLAVRLAAQIDDNDGDGVRAAHIPGQDSLSANPFNRTWSERASVRFEPTDTLQFNLTYQHMVQHFLSYQQTESTCLLTGTTCPDGYPVVTGQSRLSTVNGDSTFAEQFDIINGRADWHVFGQKLSYVGMYGVSTFNAYSPMDGGSVYNSIFFDGAQGGSNIQQLTHSRNQYQSHEVRLSSDQRIAGLFDYTVGIFTIDTPTQNHIVYDVNALVHQVVADNTGDRRETSIFGNVTVHPTEKLEISGGLRKIIASGNTSVAGTAPNIYPAAAPRWLPTIWTASASYHFTPKIMGYVSAGTSSRQGTTSVGPVLSAYGAGIFPQSAILQYADLKAEYSHSYEVGLKSQFDGRRGTFNLTYFHQNFSNFQFANSGPVLLTGVAPLPTILDPDPATPQGSIGGFGANVPVKLDGVEGDLEYRFSRNLNLGATFSYVKSRITGGTVLCNSGALLTDSIGNTVHTCAGSGPASYAPPFTATFQGEYNHDINATMTGYLRGQLSVFGATQLNQDVPLNKQDAYALLNTYVGVRDPDGNWDLSFFVKNLTNSQTVLASATGNTQAVSGLFFAPVGQPYTQIAYTPPRQFGVNLRVAFGAR